MLIWICVESKDTEHAKVTEVINAKHWALVELEGGNIRSVNFYDKREDYKEWVDFIVLKNKFESYMEFMEEGMMVLCIREEETISEIIEAFKFKELDEVGL